MGDDRLPTGVWVDAHLRRLNMQAVPYYIMHKGNHGSGIVMLKLNGLQGDVRLLIQQRDWDGNMQWMAALEQEMVAEKDADAYIRRSLDRDPDLWVIEIEDRSMNNPFE